MDNYQFVFNTKHNMYIIIKKNIYNRGSRRKERSQKKRSAGNTCIICPSNSKANPSIQSMHV